jgi:pyruvate/2-oxoglutarate dehydrogenase complex dihydrolipoamide acyltransferase (E2) component
VDESGNITETVLNESGEVVDEEVTGSLADLQVEEEYVDEQGRIVGRAVDQSGNLVEQTLDEEGNVLDLDVSETGEKRGDEDASEVRATDAARRKARELGVQLSSVKGMGSKGRILVRDVEKAAS